MTFPPDTLVMDPLAQLGLISASSRMNSMRKLTGTRGSMRWSAENQEKKANVHTAVQYADLSSSIGTEVHSLSRR